MRKTFQLLACAALLAAPLAFTTPAFADNDDEIQTSAPPMGKNHEQWEQLRAEHAGLVAERDRLMERCMNVKGQDRSACDEKWADLRERHEAWRERMVAFHEQSMSEKGPGHKAWHGHKKGMKAKQETKAEPKKDDAMTMKHHHHHHHGMKQQGTNQQPAAEPAGQ